MQKFEKALCRSELSEARQEQDWLHGRIAEVVPYQANLIGCQAGQGFRILFRGAEKGEKARGRIKLRLWSLACSVVQPGKTGWHPKRMLAKTGFLQLIWHFGSSRRTNPRVLLRVLARTEPVSMASGRGPSSAAPTFVF